MNYVEYTSKVIIQVSEDETVCKNLKRNCSKVKVSL